MQDAPIGLRLAHMCAMHLCDGLDVLLFKCLAVVVALSITCAYRFRQHPPANAELPRVSTALWTACMPLMHFHSRRLMLRTSSKFFAVQRHVFQRGERMCGRRVIMEGRAPQKQPNLAADPAVREQSIKLLNIVQEGRVAVSTLAAKEHVAALAAGGRALTDRT